LSGITKKLQSTDAWRAIEEEFLAGGQASVTQKALTLTVDELIVEAYRAVIEPHFPDSLAVVACGAYGLGRTYPYSELDIVLLVESGKLSDELKESLPEMVRLLWNAGLRVNSAVLTVAECLEAVERASVLGFSLLDRRFLAGDAAIHERLADKLPAALALHGQKMCQRLCELAAARHARFQNTSQHAEPDVKEGPGGLQDVRVIDWLAKLKPDLEERGGEERGGELGRAVEFVSSARCYLHYHAACDHNILDIEAQERVGLQPFALGKPFAEWTGKYFESARTIFNEVRRAMDGADKSQSSLLENFREYRSRLSNQEFTVSRERLLLRTPAQLSSDPALVFRMVEFIGRHGVLPAAETERRLEAARDVFAAYCAQPQPLWTALRSTLRCPNAGMALRTLDATGLLSGLFPEWHHIEYLVAADSGFHYTVGEQALRTIECAIDLGSGENAERQRFAGLFSEIDDVSHLLYALLFHEMGRGDADPAVSAAMRARAALVRIEAPDDARSAVEFLLRRQTDLSDAMSARDMDDPATARLLAERVGTVERLKLLAVMTYSRIAALSEPDKLSWRLEQLWRAYMLTQHELTRELETDRIQQVPADLPGNAEFIKGFPLRYLRAHPAAEITEHLQLYELSRPTGVAVRLHQMESAYRLTVVARDKPALFASFAGAISSFGMDILKAEAFSNAAGVILDTFLFGDPRRMLQQNPGEADRLIDLIQRIALGKTDAHRLLRSPALPDSGKRTAPSQVQFDSEACPAATLVEIEAEDRPGLLYSLATVFSSNSCNIDVVLVDTKGHRAIDVFYVAHGGQKLSAEMQARLKEKLLAAC
jgi:[protein-PII] uridylyltransferase